MKEAIVQYEDMPSGGYRATSWKPLVRCKDCISFYKNDNMFNTNAQKGMRCKASSIDPDWFCADGEQKSSNEKLMEEMDADPLG